MCRLTCIFFLEPDFFEDEFWTEFKVKNESGKAPQVPFFPKEEELSEEEQEKILQEPYMPGSSVEKIFNTYSTSVENSVLRVQHYVGCREGSPVVKKLAEKVPQNNAENFNTISFNSVDISMLVVFFSLTNSRCSLL